MPHRFFPVFLTLLALGCAESDPSVVEVSPEEDKISAPTVEDSTVDLAEFPKKMTSETLPNPVQLHPKVISGGLPEGVDAFAELQSLGVKTVISVDGMTPDVETASKYGLRYVHLPHGYDGVPDNRGQELAKAVRDLEGPIYIHCHHGKHRSPAAAAVACLRAGLIPKSKGLAVLEVGGTNPNYRGLFESVEQSEPLEESFLDALEVNFQEKLPIPPMAEAMVQISHTHDHLKQIQEAGWRTPADHPDLEPAHEALIMREHFTELLRTDEVQSQPEDYRKMLQESETAAQKLEDELRKWKSTSAAAEPPEVLGASLGLISKNCKSCHVTYRDIPLSTKALEEKLIFF